MVSSRSPIWLDCDPGHDDAFAMLLAAQLPQFELVGISTVYGNAPLSRTTLNALGLAEAFAVALPPTARVWPGADKPLQRALSNAPEIHGESGLDGTNLLPKATLADAAGPVGSAVAALAAAIEAHAGDLYVVATGTLTNIALLAAERPELLPQIKHLGIMGGGFAEGGNWTKFAEFNIWCDPEAARTVLRHQALAGRTTLVTLDMSHQAIATAEVQARILGNSSSSDGSGEVFYVRRMLYELLGFFAKTYHDYFGFKAGPPVHDPLAVAALLTDDSFGAGLGLEFGEYELDVILEGERVGETVKIGPSTKGVKVLEKINMDKFWELIYESLDNLEKNR
jgi:uridine nucleosidase